MKKTVKEVIDLLEAAGFIVAGKRNDDLAEGTLQSILREAGLK